MLLSGQDDCESESLPGGPFGAQNSARPLFGETSCTADTCLEHVMFRARSQHFNNEGPVAISRAVFSCWRAMFRNPAQFQTPDRFNRAQRRMRFHELHGSFC